MHPIAGKTAIFEVSNITFDKVEVGPLLGFNQSMDLIQIALVTGAEVIQTDDAMVEFEQGFEKVAADEAGYACNQPGFRVGLESLFEGFKCSHGYSLRSDSCVESTYFKS